MRLVCYFCGKTVSSEVPEAITIRAALVCPECIEALWCRNVLFTGDPSTCQDDPCLCMEIDKRFLPKPVLPTMDEGQK